MKIKRIGLVLGMALVLALVLGPVGGESARAEENPWPVGWQLDWPGIVGGLKETSRIQTEQGLFISYRGWGNHGFILNAVVGYNQTTGSLALSLSNSDVISPEFIAHFQGEWTGPGLFKGVASAGSDVSNVDSSLTSQTATFEVTIGTIPDCTGCGQEIGGGAN